MIKLNYRNVLLLWAILLALAVGATSVHAVTIVDADAFPAGTVISISFPDVTLSAIGGGFGTTGSVFSVTPSSLVFDAPGAEPFNASTGTRSFGHDGVFSGDLIGNVWTDSPGSQVILRADFAVPLTFVSIDVIGNDFADEGVLEAYDAFDKLLDTVITATLMLNDIETLSITRVEGDIAYILAAGDLGSTVGLDNLQYNAVPEPSTLALAALALVGLVTFVRRRRAKQRGRANR